MRCSLTWRKFDPGNPICTDLVHPTGHQNNTKRLKSAPTLTHFCIQQIGMIIQYKKRQKERKKLKSRHVCLLFPQDKFQTASNQVIPGNLIFPWVFFQHGELSRLQLNKFFVVEKGYWINYNTANLMTMGNLTLE
ncbi:hypothetical protein HYPBUDRAFT_204110 [Hyphopichia burtonii NRRL Y-1933]|uniref:Uncharacterized protein n=1 Tax=Hyphopichia burtonii NRRL Y-1933 TaxID=984485 RepID=A0A1E4RLZ6_9ASCO|nr:hypothetical protein HYPBUDRAFT_204110 [Hyphopichia burtonii NRRL Y-1933]ODV68298.1 hypothetical protein HYPBUDRAFT_204110 [Hyphopichia burtonii NRRL Y-1933]